MQLIQEVMFFDTKIINIWGVKTQVCEAWVEKEIQNGEGVKMRI